MTTKYQAIGPDGTVFKRVTKGRTYAFCVIKHNETYSYHPFGDTSIPLVEVEAGWRQIGWCSRRDLAEKLARTARAWPHIDQVVILDAQVQS